MGTRGITKVIVNGEAIVAQYGQWDHYPSGQGMTALNFLTAPGNVEKLRNNIGLIYYPSDEEQQEISSKYSKDGWMTMEQGKQFAEDYPSLTRDTGAEILHVIANATQPIPISRDLEFEDDRLFCEGVCEINLDNNTFTTKFNRYENPNDQDVLTLTFDELATTTGEEYLERAKCGVYQYHKANALV